MQAPLQVAPPPVKTLATLSTEGPLAAAKDAINPVLTDKIARVAMGEPSLSYDNPTTEFFGLPSVEGKEEGRSLRERKRLIDEYKHPIATEYKKSPTRRLLEEYMK